MSIKANAGFHEADYKILEGSVNTQTYKLSSVQDKLIKVAFDVVRFRDDDTEKLWQIQSSDDGDYIVALYPEEDDNAVVKTASTKKSPWDVVIKEAQKAIYVFHNGKQYTKLAFSDFSHLPINIPILKKTVENFFENKNPEQLNGSK